MAPNKKGKGFFWEVVFVGCLGFFLVGMRSQEEASEGRVSNQAHVETGGDRGTPATMPARFSRTNQFETVTLAGIPQRHSWSW